MRRKKINILRHISLNTRMFLTIICLICVGQDVKSQDNAKATTIYSKALSQATLLTETEKQELVKEIFPNMEVRNFIRPTQLEFSSDSEKDRQRAILRIRLITDAYFAGGRIDKTYGFHKRASIKETFISCFFSQAFYFRALKAMKEAKAIDKETLAKAQTIADEVLLVPQYQERGPNNRPFHFALGNIYAAKIFPKAPKAKRWRNYANAVWSDWYDAGDTYEPGYVAHNIMQVIELGQQLDKTKELQGDKARQAFYRYRDQLSSSGLTFAPGDGSDQSDYVKGLIAAAEITKDETLFWAADLAFWAGDYSVRGGKRRDKQSAEDQELYNELFFNLLNMGLSLKMPDTSCSIQKMFPTTYKVTDRILMTPSRKAGKPFVGYYLNDSGETTHHAHEDNRGEIYHYEVDSVMYLSRSGWSKWVGHANTFIVEDAINEFPFYNTQGMQQGYWYKGSTNMRIMRNFNESPSYHFIESTMNGHDYLFASNKKDDEGFFYVNPDALAGKCDKMKIEELSFRFVTYPKEEKGKFSFAPGIMWYREYRDIALSETPQTIIIDNLAISGPAGKHVLFDFETLPDNLQVKIYPQGSLNDSTKIRTLTGKDIFEVVSLVDSKSGNGKALQVKCDFGRTDIFFNDLDIDVNFNDDYNRVDVDYCYTSDISEFLRPPFKIGVNGQAPRSMYVDRQQGGILKSSIIDQKDEDCYSEFSYEGIFTYDSHWTRKTILTKEGYLVVCDEFTPGESAEGLIGGPVWQLLSPPESGMNWFDAVAGNKPDKKLLVYFHPDRKNRYGVQKQYKFQYDQNYAVYAQTRLKAGVPARFISVMIPHDASLSGMEVSGKTIYNAIQDTKKGQKNNVSTSIDKNGSSSVKINNLSIVIDNSGKWDIIR